MSESSAPGWRPRSRPAFFHCENVAAFFGLLGTWCLLDALLVRGHALA